MERRSLVDTSLGVPTNGVLFCLVPELNQSMAVRPCHERESDQPSQVHPVRVSR